MKQMENPRFTVAAWLILMVAYMAALSQIGCAPSIPFAVCGAIGAVGLAQAWSNLINYKKGS